MKIGAQPNGHSQDPEQVRSEQAARAKAESGPPTKPTEQPDHGGSQPADQFVSRPTADKVPTYSLDQVRNVAPSRTLASNRLARIEDRIAQGFYDRQEIKRRIADRVSKQLFELKPRMDE